MNSEFRFDGVRNNQYGFTEVATGAVFRIPASFDDTGDVQLIGGDEVLIPTHSHRNVWSVRSRQITRREA